MMRGDLLLLLLLLLLLPVSIMTHDIPWPIPNFVSHPTQQSVFHLNSLWQPDESDRIDWSASDTWTLNVKVTTAECNRVEGGAPEYLLIDCLTSNLTDKVPLTREKREIGVCGDSLRLRVNSSGGHVHELRFTREPVSMGSHSAEYSLRLRVRVNCTGIVLTSGSFWLLWTDARPIVAAEGHHHLSRLFTSKDYGILQFLSPTVTRMLAELPQWLTAFVVGGVLQDKSSGMRLQLLNRFDHQLSGTVKGSHRCLLINTESGRLHFSGMCILKSLLRVSGLRNWSSNTLSNLLGKEATSAHLSPLPVTLTASLNNVTLKSVRSKCWLVGSEQSKTLTLIAGVKAVITCPIVCNGDTARVFVVREPGNAEKMPLPPYFNRRGSFQFVEGRSVKIDKVEANDSGVYHCMAVYYAKQIWHPIKVKVLVLPYFEAHSGVFQVMQGQLMTHSCTAAATSSLSFNVKLKIVLFDNGSLPTDRLMRMQKQLETNVTILEQRKQGLTLKTLTVTTTGPTAGLAYRLVYRARLKSDDSERLRLPVSYGAVKNVDVIGIPLPKEKDFVSSHTGSVYDWMHINVSLTEGYRSMLRQLNVEVTAEFKPIDDRSGNDKNFYCPHTFEYKIILYGLNFNPDKAKLHGRFSYGPTIRHKEGWPFGCIPLFAEFTFWRGGRSSTDRERWLFTANSTEYRQMLTFNFT